MRTLACLVALAACGTEYQPPPGPDGATAGTSAYTTLISGSWSLPPSSEKYVCIRQTVDRDIYISTLSPIAPQGTHHTVLMVGPPDAPDGVTDCTSALVKPSIFASGVGTGAFEMPSGIAIHLRPGDQLLQNLHLFNSDTENSISGTSGTQIIETDASTVEHEAGALLAGKEQGLVVDLGVTQQTGTCTLPPGTTEIAMAPHMHLTGTHMTVTYGSRTIFDNNYVFDNQQYNMLSPYVDATQGDVLTVTCTYDNETGEIIHFGESTTDEMCFALTMVYPPPTASVCTQ